MDKDKKIKELEEEIERLWNIKKENEVISKLIKKSKKLQDENDELEGTNRMWKDEIERLKDEYKVQCCFTCKEFKRGEEIFCNYKEGFCINK